jgi:hypothetical protein
MSDNQVQSYLHSVESSLNVERRDRRRILDEIESHLYEGISEYSQAGSDHGEAVALAIGDLGTPDDVAAAFSESDRRPTGPSGALRWLPVALPVVCAIVAFGLLSRMLVQSSLPWTAGDRIVLKDYSRWAALYAGLSAAAWICARQSDRDIWWWRLAWIPSVLALAIALLR